LANGSETVRSASAAESVETFDWRGLHFHVITAGPLPGDQVSTIRRTLPEVASVGFFADLLAMTLGRHVRIRTERPSPDIRFEVGP
jgi:hypothetical protein